MIAALCWMLGFAALTWLAARATARARAHGGELERRSAIATGGLLALALGATAAWSFGGRAAHQGTDRRLREGLSVQLALEQLEVVASATAGAQELVVGFADAVAPARAAPARGRLALAGEGPWELVRLSRERDRWRLTADAGAILLELPGDALTAPGARRDVLTRACKTAPRLGQARSASAPAASPAASLEIEAPAASAGPVALRWAVVRCSQAPLAVALGVAALSGDRTKIAVAPLRGPRWQPSTLRTSAGAVLQLGGGEPGLPGVQSWRVGGPPGTGWVLAVPADPRACAAWAGPGTGRGAPGAPGVLPSTRGSCRLGLGPLGAAAQADSAGAVVLRATPALPDREAVLARGLLAGALVVGPIGLSLLALALARGSSRRTAALAPALRLAVFAVGAAALACWRLLWAHRIDALRDGDAAAGRIAMNQLSVILLGAAIAGLVIAGRLGATPARPRLRRFSLPWRGVAVLASWASWLALGVVGAQVALPADVAPLALVTARPLLAVGLTAASAALAVAPLAAAWWADLPRPTTTRAAQHRVALAAGALAALALAGAVLAPHLVLAKLGLAYAVALVGAAALRRALAAESSAAGRAAALAAVALAAGAVLAYDTGVGLAITGVGLTLALVLAGHDSIYRDSAAPRLGLLEREHARVLISYGAAAVAVAAGVAAWGLAVSDRWLVEHTAGLFLHLPLALALAFALGALLAWRHGQPRAPYVAAAAAALALWSWRQPMLERVMAGPGVSAHRVSAVLDPGYALLRDERRFLAQTSAWQAATLPPAVATDTPARAADAPTDTAADAADGAPAASAPPHDLAARWRGQGLFGARITDPGVALSIDNDYLPVLVVRELGVEGLLQSTLLLLALLLAAGQLASARLPHASDAARARSLLIGIGCALTVYQPLAALGILPLTGISAPGLGIDSPADLWLLLWGLAWATSLGGPAASPVGRLADPAGEPPADERVRTSPRLRRARTLAGLALAACGLAGVAMVARAGASALGRVGSGLAGAGDPRVVRAVAYARSLRCQLVPGAAPRLEGTPTDEATARFHRELGALWERERAAPERRWAQVAASREPRRDEPTEPCAGRLGRWRFERTEDDRCRATLDAGWPQIRLERGADDTSSCAVDLPGDALTALARHTPAPALPRIRIVSRAMGDAARDLGEVLVGGAVVRLRAGAPDVDLSAPGAAVDGGLVFASRVRLGGGAAIELRDQRVTLVGAPRAWEPELRGPPGAWRAAPAASTGATLARATLVAAEGSVVALVRPRSAWPGKAPADDDGPAAPAPAHDDGPATPAPAHDDGPATPAPAHDELDTADPLLADQVLTAAGGRRRTYPHGAALPQLGWVNPFAVERSLGLDGWVHAALAQPAVTPPPSCGALAPPDIPRASVCATSPLDGVLECRIALQPELSRALESQLAAALAAPRDAKRRSAPPLRASAVLLRGDTGELLVQRELAWGRGPSAYAPRTADDEQRLIRLREDRDPTTGEPGFSGESDGERADWNQPMAVGSVLKPVLARATELAFPELAPSLVLGFSGQSGTCKARSGGAVSALAGHCPPTSLAGQPVVADLHDFLARSPNWYQAALGVLGLGFGQPEGSYQTGDVPRTLLEVLGSDLSAWPTDEPLTIHDEAGPILGKRSVVLAGLRRAPLWRAVEGLLGRPLCELGDRRRCAAAAARRDVCALRALPLAEPGADLRHLVALGPDRFDLFADDRPGQTQVPIREYLQWLRGSGLHPAGSLAQLTDTFSRVVYEPAPARPSQPEPARLAASYFPAPVVGALPSWRCQVGASERTASVRGAGGGLCGVLAEGGTAHRALAPLLSDPRLLLYGAKSGTIDSLAQVARKRSSCEAWNRRHTLAGAPAVLAEQPGWLECGKAPPDDSLLVIAFAVVTPTETVPLTLGVSLQRAGKGAAARLAPAIIATIADYFDPSTAISTAIAPATAAPPPSAPGAAARPTRAPTTGAPPARRKTQR